ncbi:MAG TPA: DUF4175 family protein [Ignavibacteria bacterium]
MDTVLSKGKVIFDEFEKKLSITNKKELNFNLIKNLLLTAIVFFAGGYLLTISEAVFMFGIKMRTFMYWSFVLTLAATISYLLVNYFLKITGIFKPFDVVDYSRKVGFKFSEIKDTLSNSLSLFKYSGNTINPVYSNELIIANLQETESRAKGINFSSFIPYNAFKKLSVIFAGILFLFIISFAVFPSSLFSSLNRLLNYNFNFIDGEYGIVFDIQPGNIESFKGENVEVKIRVIPNKPGLKIDEINFITKNVTLEGDKILNSQKSLKPDEKGIFSTRIENINTQLIYFAEFRGVTSEEYKITLADYPIIKNFRVTIIPPEFTGLSKRVMEENRGDIYCFQGSKVLFELTSNSELTSAGIVMNGGYNNFSVNGASANGEIIAKDNGIYKFSIKDKDGLENRNSSSFEIKILKDEPPKISIIQPQESNYTLKGEKEIVLRAVISDDFGFSRLTLHSKKISGNSSASDFYSVVAIPIKNPDATSLEVPYVWNLYSLNLRSGEKIEYYMEVTDNTGNTTRSDTRTLTFISLSEILKKNQQTSKEIQTNLKSIKEYIEEIQKEVKSARNDSKNTEELGLNDPAKNLALQNKIEDLKSTLNATQNKIDQTLKELEQRNMLNDKTYEQFMKLQELFNKINSPEFLEKLRKLQEALKKNNPDQIREEMKNLNFDEEAFKKQMEQIEDLLKKIENLQKLGELSQKMDEITKEQESLKKETENSDKSDRNKMDNLSQKQYNLQNKLSDFKNELKDLSNKIKDSKDDIDSKSLDNLKNKLDSKNTEGKMNKSSKQLESGEKESSEKTQEDILNDLNEMNEDMQNAFDKAMDTNADSKAMNKLKDIKKNLEELSENQQDLKEKTEDTKKSDKNEFDKQSKEQSDLQGKLTKEINDLMELTKSGLPISPELGKELGNAYNSMDKAGKDLKQCEKNNATDNQTNAKNSLDNSAKMLGDMIGNMEKNGMKSKGKGKEGRMGQLMQKLSSLIGRQQGVNGEMQQLGEDGKTGTDGKGGQEGLTNEQKMRIDKLRLEQEGISKSLEELNEEFEKERINNNEKFLGNLNEVAKEMKEIIKDMQDYKVDDNTIEKQNRIVSRMLDFQLAQREKDFEQKRESKPGENMTRTSPPEVILSGPKSFNAFKEDFLKLQKQGYTEEYEALITKYLMYIRNNQ